MKHFPAGSRAFTRPNPEHFTGDVWMDPMVSSPAPARMNAVTVHFDPGARTAWHTHPLGQTLHVTSGKGLFCMRGETPFAILPGDTIWIDPAEEHWHGASPDVGMTHIAMQECDDAGSAATWLDKVNDADYGL